MIDEGGALIVTLENLMSVLTSGEYHIKSIHYDQHGIAANFVPFATFMQTFDSHAEYDAVLALLITYMRKGK